MTTLQQAAQAVLDRWDSPAWQRAPVGRSNAALMADLRRALAAHKEQAEPVAMSASGMTKELAFINGKTYHIDPRQAQWIEDRLRAVQAEPVKLTDAAIEAAITTWFEWRMSDDSDDAPFRDRMRAAINAAQDFKEAT
jgi:hypothetical protein